MHGAGSAEASRTIARIPLEPPAMTDEWALQANRNSRRSANASNSSAFIAALRPISRASRCWTSAATKAPLRADPEAAFYGVDIAGAPTSCATWSAPEILLAIP